MTARGGGRLRFHEVRMPRRTRIHNKVERLEYSGWSLLCDYDVTMRGRPRLGSQYDGRPGCVGVMILVSKNPAIQQPGQSSPGVKPVDRMASVSQDEKSLLACIRRNHIVPFRA